MIKFAQLFDIIDNFSKTAHRNYRLIKSAAGSQELLDRLEDFDIKNKQLFEQYEGFSDSYRELLESLPISEKDLQPDTVEKAMEVFTTFKTRLGRIITNNYLNMGNEYEEDFDPGDFTEFLMEVASDAEHRMKSVIDEDIDLAEAEQAQYAKQFVPFQEEMQGTKQDEWAAFRKDKANQSNKRRHENLMFLKKLDINHPTYQAYITYRRQTYQNIISGPQAAAYREKSKARSLAFIKRRTERLNEIKVLLSKPMGSEKRKELEQELNKMQARVDKDKEKWIQDSVVLKDKKESKNFEGLLIQLQQGIPNVKMGLKKDITADLKNKESYFKPFEDKLNAAQAAGNTIAIDIIKKDFKKALNKAAEEDPLLMMYKNTSVKYIAFISKLDVVRKQGWIDNTNIPIEDIREHLVAIKNEGLSLLKEHQRQPARHSGKPMFSSPNSIIIDIIKLIDKRLTQ